MDIFEHHEKLVERVAEETDAGHLLRCCNQSCDLFNVQLEPDEVDVVNGHELLCSACHQPLTACNKHAEPLPEPALDWSPDKRGDFGTPAAPHR